MRAANKQNRKASTGAAPSHSTSWLRPSRLPLAGAVVLILLALTAWGRGTAPAGAAPQRIAAGSATATPTPTAGPSTQTGPTVPIIVKFKAGTNAAAMDATVGTAGGKTVRTHSQIRTRVINVPAAERDTILAAFKKQGNVERATAAIKLGKASGPNDPAYPQQWALPKIAWDTAYGSVSISGTATIAVLDTGIDAAHPDLAGNVVAGQSFLGTDPNSDPNGHGTALAGIAAASTNNSTGMAGVAWKGASVSSVQVLGADGTGYDSDVMSGILWAADNGASVILMGFSSGSPDNAIGDAVSYAQSKGATLVAATGNDGSTAATYPAAIAGVIGVAATDQNDAVASFSNTGSAAVAAPGVGIYATAPGGGYTTLTGTSAAAAETAGLAALLSASGKSAAAIASQITGTADSIGGAFGRIDVARTFGATVATPTPTATPSATSTPTATSTPNPTGTVVAASSATISGTVTDSVTHLAISGATVTCLLLSGGCNSTVSTTTFANGS